MNLQHKALQHSFLKNNWVKTALLASLFCVRDLYLEVVQAQVQPKAKPLQFICLDCQVC